MSKTDEEVQDSYSDYGYVDDAVVFVSEGPEGTYDQGYPGGATLDAFLESASKLLGYRLKR